MEKSIICNINVITPLCVKLVNVRMTEGHDDSLPFHCDVYLYDRDKGYPVKVGTAMNNGWGGETEITALNNNAVKLIDEIDTFLRKVYEIRVNNKGVAEPIKWDVRLNYLIDCMVYRCLANNVVRMNITELSNCYNK